LGKATKPPVKVAGILPNEMQSWFRWTIVRNVRSKITIPTYQIRHLKEEIFTYNAEMAISVYSFATVSSLNTSLCGILI
jgi:hypothetical protein